MKQANIGWSLTRRQLLGSFAALAASAVGSSALGACSGAPTATPVPTTSAPKATAPTVATPVPAASPQAAAPAAAAPVAASPKPAAASYVRPVEPKPKRGGTLRIAAGTAATHLDLHQGAQLQLLSHLYSGLVRMDIKDYSTVVPELAESWDISPDGKVYTFKLRRGVKFSDGSPFNAEDAEATFSRVVKPPKGVASIFASDLTVVDKVEAVDAQTVRFTLKHAWVPFLEFLAEEALVVYPKKALVENNYDLRKVIAPGTGPFKVKEARVQERWLLERNSDFFDPELPYLDAIEILNVPEMGDRGVAVMTGRADFTPNTSVSVYKEALTKPDSVSADEVPNRTFQSVTINNEHKPFNDKRVRRAIHLAVSRQNLEKATADVYAITLARWIVPTSRWAMPLEEVAKLPGYRADKTADIAEAKKLLAEAGYPNGFGPVDLVTSSVANQAQLSAPAFQAELRQSLNITSKIRTMERNLLPKELANGTFDLLWESVYSFAVDDPTSGWPGFLKCGGSTNYSRYCNAELDKMLDQLTQEVDQGKRRQQMAQVTDLLDQEIPFFVVGTGTQRALWKPYVKGLNVPAMRNSSWGRFVTAWLDK